MRISLETKGDVAILACHNDYFKARQFDAVIGPILQTNPKLVFDMRRIQFIDSAGCGILLACLKTLINIGGDLKLCRVHASVQTLLELLRLHRIFEVFDTREEAVVSFNRRNNRKSEEI